MLCCVLSQVEVLNQQVCGALSNIRLLRAHLGDADVHTYSATCQVMALQQRRKNIDQTLDALQVSSPQPHNTVPVAIALVKRC